MTEVTNINTSPVNTTNEQVSQSKVDSLVQRATELGYIEQTSPTIEQHAEVPQEQEATEKPVAQEVAPQKTKPSVDSPTARALKIAAREAKANREEKLAIQKEKDEIAKERAKYEEWAKKPGKFLKDNNLTTDHLVNDWFGIEEQVQPPALDQRVEALERREKELEIKQLEQEKTKIQESKDQKINAYISDARSYVETNNTKYPLLNRSKSTDIDVGETVATVIQQVFTKSGKILKFEEAANYLELTLAEERKFLLQPLENTEVNDVLPEEKDTNTGAAATKANNKAPITSLTNKMSSVPNPNKDPNKMSDEERESWAMSLYRAEKAAKTKN